MADNRDSSTSLEEQGGDADVEVEQKGHEGQAKKDMEAFHKPEDDARGAVDEKKLDKALTFLTEAQAKTPKSARELEMDKVVISKQDLEIVMREFEITKAKAEKVLRESDGNVETALMQLVGAAMPKSTPASDAGEAAESKPGFKPYEKPVRPRRGAAPAGPPEPPAGAKVVAQFQSADGEPAGPPLNLPIDVNPEQLELLLNNLLQNDDPMPYSFSVDDTDITSNLFVDIIHGLGKSSEHVLAIKYQPQAVFKVRTVTRCTSSLSGHTEAILSVCFSPDGKMLATGSGDTTVRIWDLNTETPRFTLVGHKNWVQIVAWSPDCQMLASGSMDETIRLWNPQTGKPYGDALRAHSKCITSIAWEPFHLNKMCNRFASAAKDNTVRIWDALQRRVSMALSQHTAPIMCVKWGGNGFIYTGSRDKTIRVWDSTDGKLVHVLEGHAHWVNHLALSTEFLLRTGPYDHRDPVFKSREDAFEAAKKRYAAGLEAAGGVERLASGSDDFTLFLWEPTRSKKPLARMTGHQQLVNHLSFSPDGRMLASASFDKSVKLWEATTGKFITTLRGHVSPVYQVCWSSDSRQVLSGSRDTTLKVWDIKTKKMKAELPGHADEVFSVDWSPGGDRVASGGKDRILKM
ncbi:ribosome assembly [Polyrhizophydium stewartii]|uniref:Ribosome assembly n=1 Tax=Polyrhizophydium stewartii TaxID=2732419 RepID=A0ABR4N781_9FUNG|nr:Notchless protein 1 [Polyrhizophydium stewartii]